VYQQYAHDDGISLEDFERMERDGLLLEGKINADEPADAAIPKDKQEMQVDEGRESRDGLLLEGKINDDAKADTAIFKDKQEVEVDGGRKSRFFSFADGEGDDARLSQDALRDLLECTGNFCVAKLVEEVYQQYAHDDGISLEDFERMERDGLLLEGKINENGKADAAIDVDGTGLITRECLGKLSPFLGCAMSPEELELLERTHLKLQETLRPVDLSSPEFAPDANLGEVTTVHREAELNAIVANGADAIVKLAFTWCRPCKAFWPKYKKFARIYKNTRFVKIVGDENESCKHYARDVLKASNSPTFAVYSKGRLVEMWHGPNTAHFIENIEKHLESASALVLEREVAVAADPKLAPATPQRESILRGKIAWGRA